MKPRMLHNLFLTKRNCLSKKLLSTYVVIGIRLWHSLNEMWTVKNNFIRHRPTLLLTYNLARCLVMFMLVAWHFCQHTWLLTVNFVTLKHAYVDIRGSWHSMSIALCIFNLVKNHWSDLRVYCKMCPKRLHLWSEFPKMTNLWHTGTWFLH